MMFIPPELTDRIIDFLHNDYHTLHTCATICREWLPSARLHIFRNCRPKFDRELLRTSPRIGYYIRKLKITRHFDPRPDHGGSLVGLRRNFPNVDDICLSGTDDTVWNFQCLLDIISSLPSLQTFGLEFMEIPVEDVMPSETSRTSIEVLCLKNVDWDLALLMDRAIAADAFSSVHTLYYICNYEHYGEGLLRFLRHYGSNLVAFSIEGLPTESGEGGSPISI